MKQLLHFVACLFITGYCAAQEPIDVAPGIDRWGVKTSANISSTRKTVTLKNLLALPLLDEKYSGDSYDDKLIPVQQNGNLKEGDLITTSGYLQLVALERDSKKHRDGDYHIQLTLYPEWGDSCFIVEIPYAEFVNNKALKDSCNHARKFINEKILKGKSPGNGNVMNRGVYVKVTGQLFYDAIHASQMRNPDPNKRAYRGKKGKMPMPMHSYTAWELHPLVHIEFAREPR